MLIAVEAGIFGHNTRILRDRHSIAIHILKVRQVRSFCRYTHQRRVHIHPKSKSTFIDYPIFIDLASINPNKQTKKAQQAAYYTKALVISFQETFLLHPDSIPFNIPFSRSQSNPDSSSLTRSIYIIRCPFFLICI